MTLDGTINVVLVAIAAAVVIYLFVALLDPERF
ncbi:MAG: K(+)-transporting ATPase subunit F [Rhodococcus sp. (in: high G+C Gram-positive bacteria)]